MKKITLEVPDIVVKFLSETSKEYKNAPPIERVLEMMLAVGITNNGGFEPIFDEASFKKWILDMVVSSDPKSLLER